MLSKMQSADIPSRGTPRAQIFIEDFGNQSHLKNLPCEVIEHIFSFLDKKSLKDCALVQKQFNEIIGVSKKLMSRFTLRMNKGKARTCPELLRCYRRIVINRIQKHEFEDVQKIMQKIGAKATFVSIDYCDVPSNNRLLSCFPNVETLRVLGPFRSSEVVDPLFPKLKFLVFNDPSSVQMFSGIKNLENLEMFLHRDHNWQHVTQLLGNQTSLNTLVIGADDFPTSLRLPVHRNLKVRHLVISGVFQDAEFSNFIQPFRGHAEYLTYRSSRTYFLEFALQRIMQDWNSVKGLDVKAKVPTDEAFYLRTQVNPNLTHLVLWSRSGVTALLGIFRIFPNLKNLTIITPGLTDQGVPPADIRRLQNHFKRLDKFRVVYSESRDPAENIRTMNVLRHITFLIIVSRTIKCDWQMLKEACADSKALFIDVFRSTTPLDLESFLETLPNLEMIQFGHDSFKLEHLDILARKLHKVKTLHLKKATSTMVEALKDIGIRVLFENQYTDCSWVQQVFSIDKRFNYF